MNELGYDDDDTIVLLPVISLFFFGFIGFLFYVPLEFYDPVCFCID